MAAVIGTGTTVTYQSGFFADIIELEWSGITRASFETSSFATTGGMTYMAGTLYDPGEISVRMAFDPEIDITTAMTAADETVTVTFADPVAASTLAASGRMRDFTITVPLEDRVTANAVIKLSGSITHG